MLQLATRTAHLGKEQKRLRKRYVQLRKASQRLNGRILDHLPRGALIQSARALGLRHSGEIVLADMLEANVILDYALHDYRKGRAPSTIERFVSPAFDRRLKTWMTSSRRCVATRLQRGSPS